MEVKKELFEEEKRRLEEAFGKMKASEAPEWLKPAIETKATIEGPEWEGKAAKVRTLTLEEVEVTGRKPIGQMEEEREVKEISNRLDIFDQYEAEQKKREELQKTETKAEEGPDSGPLLLDQGVLMDVAKNLIKSLKMLWAAAMIVAMVVAIVGLGVYMVASDDWIEFSMVAMGIGMTIGSVAMVMALKTRGNKTIKNGKEAWETIENLGPQAILAIAMIISPLMVGVVMAYFAVR